VSDPGPVPTPDHVVGRVNDLALTFLDVLAALLLAAAAGYGAWQAWGIGWGLASAGVAVLALSLSAQAKAHPRPVKVAARKRPKVPGPSDPGPVHIAGGE